MDYIPQEGTTCYVASVMNGFLYSPFFRACIAATFWKFMNKEIRSAHAFHAFISYFVDHPQCITNKDWQGKARLAFFAFLYTNFIARGTTTTRHALAIGETAQRRLKRSTSSVQSKSRSRSFDRFDANVYGESLHAIMKYAKLLNVRMLVMPVQAYQLHYTLPHRFPIPNGYDCILLYNAHEHMASLLKFFVQNALYYASKHTFFTDDLSAQQRIKSLDNEQLLTPLYDYYDSIDTLDLEKVTGFEVFFYPDEKHMSTIVNTFLRSLMTELSSEFGLAYLQSYAETLPYIMAMDNYYIKRLPKSIDTYRLDFGIMRLAGHPHVVAGVTHEGSEYVIDSQQGIQQKQWSKRMTSTDAMFHNFALYVRNDMVEARQKDAEREYIHHLNLFSY